MQRWVVFCWALLALVAAEECPDGGRCAEGQTCCNDPTNGYECCPLEQAECCGDHTHCCPAGTICNSAESSCVNATMSIPWVERASADPPRLSKSFRMIKTYMREEDDNICPDQSRCPSEFSCLKALTRFGCCPLAQGVPCSDGKHCCPESHQCSGDSSSCIGKDLVTIVLCNDGVSECPDQTTCCEGPEGTWGCCPMPKAVCCEDKVHCCPEACTCDIQNSKCISSSTKKEMPMWAKLPARIRAEWENKKEAEEVTAGEANDGAAEKSPKVTTAITVPPSEEEASVSSVTKGVGGNDVQCNDTVACLDGSTCCRDKDHEWACCPLPEAVCCEDFIHCCPKGQKCNLTTQTCSDNTCSIPLVKKMPAFPRQRAPVGDVICDSTTSCPDGNTCCKNNSGGWACCPLPEAVCCQDLEHCCPKGKQCNLAAQSCDDVTRSVPWLEKVAALPRQDAQVGDVACNTTAACQDGETCCKTKDGGWSCCPLPQAVCCDDHVHCCPNGSTCDLATLTCDSTAGSTPMNQKMPAFATPAPTTAATTASSQVPSSTQTEEEEPEEEPEEVPEEDEIPTAQEEDEDVKSRIKCDDQISCPLHTTCCLIGESHQWGCCPLPEAVCCIGGEHCCPADYKCDESGTHCVKGELVIPSYTKLAATTTTSSVQADSSSVQCDALNLCPERTTCCQLVTGEWGCCPLQNAVCCPDKEHCCPQGYSCNTGSTSCHKLIMLQLETVPLTPVYLPERRPRPSPVKQTDVHCDEQTRCMEGQTCCRMSTTTWGCCQFPNAVCCSDMTHCCPSSCTCNEAGVCNHNTRLNWHNWHSWHMFLSNKKRALIV
ncbi:granulin a isoform X2 [Hippoglossus hippoglossus]|uniref:granulin a isoform X2 n=1 Tax=Hippoglossus hippoglossus TaxID=8267 RepID=UPI00148DDFA6|nr:granulin a isoform X2 [Hippoglossus hippoglossus]